MGSVVLFDAAGRRRSVATLPYTAPAFGSVVDGVGVGAADKIVADIHPEHHDEVVLLQHRPTSRLALGQQGWKRGS
jgi:hypothetical protein